MSRLQPSLRLVALVFGLVVLAVSGIGILRFFGPAAFSSPTVHEAEGRSLVTVALFPGHGLRELPHVILIGLLWLEGLLGPLPWRRARVILVRTLCVGAVSAVVLLIWAAAESGWASAWLDLSQARAAADLIGAGSHFRFHLLSDLALGALFFCAGRLFRSNDRHERGAPWFAIAFTGLMLVLLAAWGAADIATPRYIGHQAREIFTHSIVTLPLLVGLTVGRRGSLRAILQPAVLISLAVATGITMWLGWSVLQVDILSHGANPEIPAGVNLAVHNYEHLIDLAILVALSVIATRAIPARPVNPAIQNRSD